MKESTILLTFLSTNKVKSKLHLLRYIKMIKFYQSLNLTKSQPQTEITENHHILPKSMFPELAKNKDNIVTVPARAHYLLHYFLFKSISHRGCVYAFNQMRRISKQRGILSCRLYMSVKTKFAKIISENNKGRVMSLSNKKQISDRFKDTNLYRNKKTKKLKRFKAGQNIKGWEPFQTGRIRSPESKNKTKNSNSNRIWQYNKKTKDVKFEKVIIPGYTKGFPPWIDNNSDYIKNTKWIHNTSTKENKRVQKNQKLPDGWKTGRGNYDNTGLSTMNNKNYTTVFDLITKKSCLIDISTFDPYRHIKHGKSADNILFYKYKNVVYTSYKDLITENKELPDLSVRNETLLTKKIKPPHYNMTTERQQFCLINQGKTMKDIGLSIIKFKNYYYNKEELHVKCK